MEPQNEINVTSSQLEVIKSMEPFVGEQLPSLLVNVDESWQPSDFLPELNAENWVEQLSSFRKRASALPDELLVVLVGDTVTEEALPTYQTWLNRLNGLTDNTGVSSSPWARWSRGWTSEENRHGDLLNKYLYLTGRVDMRAVETTIHHLLNNGFDPQTENDPYMGFVYTSFQERATKISHRNVGVLAKRAGEDHLHKICGMIAGDEARHEKAYKLFMKKVFEIDPGQALLAFSKMMKSKIVMPAILMDDGNDKNLFSKFSIVAQNIGVYTAHDYAEIVGTLVKDWMIEGITGISGTSAKAQDYLCGLSERYAKLAERIKFSGVEKFSWLYDREIALASST
ncbi:MAG: acyl-ACP desaturase [Ignavibacteriae bacterium]|nr:MAG: acyl-ACP desaturase [Ignavibacteriota bacterium]